MDKEECRGHGDPNHRCEQCVPVLREYVDHLLSRCAQLLSLYVRTDVEKVLLEKFVLETWSLDETPFRRVTREEVTKNSAPTSESPGLNQ